MKKGSSNPSSVEAHHHDPKTGRLTVTFRGGRKYRYDNVDAATAAGLASAPSKGKFMNAHVLGKFPATKL